ADYVIDPGHCLVDLLTIAGGCDISVRFAPQVAGPRPASLTVTLDEADGTQNSAVTELTGTGVSVLVIGPSSYDFGSVIVGQPAPPVTFTVSNTGSTKLFPN